MSLLSLFTRLVDIQSKLMILDTSMKQDETLIEVWNTMITCRGALIADILKHPDMQFANGVDAIRAYVKIPTEKPIRTDGFFNA